MVSRDRDNRRKEKKGGPQNEQGCVRYSFDTERGIIDTIKARTRCAPHGPEASLVV